MILVDTHVHIHSCFDIEVFLASAARNFRSAAVKYCPEQPYRAVLCLTEDAGISEFEHFRKLAGNHSGLNGWSVGRTGERHSLILSHHDLGELTILAGRQIRCEEGLEVLALGTSHSFDDGITVSAAIEQIHGEAALAVLPWGFGKWTGRRGRVVRGILESRKPEEISLGDNSGRLAWWPEPGLFETARRNGFRILPGTDPLPFPSEVTRAASCGVAVQGNLSSTEPARALIEILSEPSVQIRPFGRLETPLRFLRNQLAMQLVKRQMEMSRA
jgi:hypothetical protein